MCAHCRGPLPEGPLSKNEVPVYAIAASSRREGSGARSCYVLATQLSPRTRTVFCMNPVKEAVVEEGLRCPLLIGCISHQYKVPVY